MERRGAVPDDEPSVAGTYQGFLDEHARHTFPADRDHTARVEAEYPDIRPISRANRAFLIRAVRALAQSGVRQFLDLGAGRISRAPVHPAVRDVHEVAQEVRADARVLYADIDATTAEFGKATLIGTPNVEYLHADVRRPQEVWASDEVAAVLDVDEPVAVLMAAMLPFVSDQDDPAGLVARYRDATVPGSYLVITHATTQYHPRQMAQVEQVYNSGMPLPMTMRSRAQIEVLLDGYDLLDPGLVDVSAWRPEEGGFDPFPGDPQRYNLLVAVGRRR